MQITRENPTARWIIMAATWAFVAAIAIWHSGAMRDYIGLLQKVARPGTANATPMERPIPGNFADAQAWVRYALAAQETGQWQLRHTNIDNAPQGRELHWSSLFAHLVSAAGRFQHSITNQPLPRATENALAWFNLPVLMVCVVFFSAWAAVRLGAGAGVVVAMAFIGHPSFYDGFIPNYADHHGLLTAAAYGLVFGMMLMGAGWVREARDETNLLPSSRAAARNASILSALCGAFGMWISAASTIPVIGIVGVTGLAAVVLFGRRAAKEGAIFEPGLWRLWGRVGAVACVVFYCLEYAPGHLGFRLEVNHPFHALAWWGGGDLIALLAAWHLDPKKNRPASRQLVLTVAAVLVSPLTIVLGGAAVFIVRDPFVADLRHMVIEGLSVRAAARLIGIEYVQRYLINFVAVGVGLWLVMITRRDRVAIGFITLAALAFVALACWEIRWWLTTSASVACLFVSATAVVCQKRSEPMRWAVVLGLTAVVLPMGAIAAGRLLQKNVGNRTADQADLLQSLYRDIAITLRATQPSGEIVVLASPDASNSLGYYGGFKSLGTLYWENVAGLKAAAAIYNAERDDAALELIRARGITHLVMVSKGDFTTEYFTLANPTRPVSEVERGFAHRVFFRRQIPTWLRAIPYRPPPGIGIADLRVVLYQVAPNQTAPEAFWNLARTNLESDNAAGAEQLFRRAIEMINPDQRAALFHRAGDLAVQQRADAAAIRLYRDGFALGAAPKTAVELSWLLATNANATLRNGREALAVIEPAAKANPNDVLVLNAWAAALAENGRFPEAVEAATHAVNTLRATGDMKNVALMQQRLDTYRANRPWRQ